MAADVGRSGVHHLFSSSSSTFGMEIKGTNSIGALIMSITLSISVSGSSSATFFSSSLSTCLNSTTVMWRFFFPPG